MLQNCSVPLFGSSNHRELWKGRGRHRSSLSLRARITKTDGQQVNQQEIIKLNSSSQISPVKPSKCEMKQEVCWQFSASLFAPVPAFGLRQNQFPDRCSSAPQVCSHCAKRERCRVTLGLVLHFFLSFFPFFSYPICL